MRLFKGWMNSACYWSTFQYGATGGQSFQGDLEALQVDLSTITVGYAMRKCPLHEERVCRAAAETLHPAAQRLTLRGWLGLKQARVRLYDSE